MQMRSVPTDIISPELLQCRGAIRLQACPFDESNRFASRNEPHSKIPVTTDRDSFRESAEPVKSLAA